MNSETMFNRKSKKKNEEAGGLFIPAGLFLGMGLGFFYGNIAAGIFGGLGAGFLLFAVSMLIKK